MKKLVTFICTFALLVTTAHAASLSFLVVHPGDGTSYTKSSSTITWTTTLQGTSFLFTSANPADVTFSGNDVAGQFSYVSNGQTYRINGVISRPQKTGNTLNGFYFYESTVLGGNVATGKAWLFQVPGRTVSASPSGTASNPVGPEMETIRQTQVLNVQPVITSNGGGLNASLTIPENTTSITTVAANVYSGSTKTFSLSGGADKSKFNIDPLTGILTFIAAPDYEIPTDAGLNNVYDVQVTVTDAQGATDVQNIAVTITNTNDNTPIITSNGGGAAATINLLTNATTVTTVTATDTDYGDVLTYAISGGTNSSLFNISASSGALTFKSPAANGTYYVNVTVTDALGHTDVQNLTVIVSATDTTSPSLVITSSDGNLSAGEICTISFKFSELVQGFTLSDVGVTGGTLGSITQSGIDATLYTASFTQSGSGTAPTFNVGAASYQDLANNNGTAASLNLSYDVVPPTVVVSFASADISYGENDLVTFTFSENPGSTFTLGDIITQNGILTNLVQTANPLIWNATLQATSATLSPTVTVQNQSYTDLAGNLGSSGAKTIPLVPPSIDLANTPTSDTGISSMDNITSNRKPVVTGFVDAGTATVTVTVQYYVNTVLTTLIYNSVPVSNQIYSLDLSVISPSTGTMPGAGLPEGYVLLNVTTPTSAVASSQFFIDLTAPAPTPTVNTLTTYDQTPSISGSATVTDTEVLKVAVNGITYTNGDGYLSLNGTNWTLSIPIANKIPAASYGVTATVTDAAGNVATDATSNELVINASNVTIDLANTSASDTGTSSTDNLTSNRTPVINGTASGSDATVKVTVLSGGIAYTYNSVAVISGNYSLDLFSATPSSIVPTGSFPAGGFPAGTVNLTVEGNTSGAISTNTFVIDFTAPVAPVVNSQTTTNTKPTIKGTGSFITGDILKVTINGVTYTSGDGNLSYNLGAGTWSLTIPNANALSVAAYPTTAYITDAAGNVSATGSGTTTITLATVTVDLANTPTSDTGTSSTDNLTSNRKPVIVGTASNDAVVTVVLTLGGTSYTYNNVSVSSTNWSLDLATATTTSGASFPGTGLTTGTWSINVTGNTTAATGSNSFVEDYTAPTAPTVNYLSTYDTTPTITGTATVDAGDRFSVLVNGIVYTNGDGYMSYSSGNWTLTIPVANQLAVNTYTVVATVVDNAGNSSANADINNLLINEMQLDVQTYNIITSPTFTTANISWSNGSKTNRVVFMKEGVGSITNPTNGVTYAASSNWESLGAQLSSSGYYCIYNGSSANGSVNVINLYPGRTYTIQAFEYSGSIGSEIYLTNISGVNNPTTVVPWPTTTFTNSVGVSSAEAWNNPSRWDHNTVPTASLHEAVRVYIDGNCELLNEASCYNLTIYAPHNGITPKLTINAGKLLNVIGGSLNGELTNLGAASALVIKSSPSSATGSLIYHNSASNHVYATVEMYSKAFTDTKYHWQYFGIPVKSQTVGTTFGAYPERVRKYDESNADPYNSGLWYPAGSTATLSPSTLMIPVDGYEVTQPNSKIYTFIGELNNQDVNRRLQFTSGANWAGQNIVSNPYVCAIDISQLSFGSQTESAVYLYNTGSLAEWESNSGSSTPGSNPGTYIVSTPLSAGTLGVPDQIPAMQGFLVNANSNSSDATFGISYNTLIGNTRQQRVKTSNSAANKVCTSIDVIGTNNSDKVWIFSDPTCTRFFDNGWDGRKFIGTTTQICAMENDGNYQIDAISDINNTYLGFQPGIGNTFQLIFTHQNLELRYSELILTDLYTGTVRNVTANNSSYTFSATAGSPLAKRFKLTAQPDLINAIVDKSEQPKVSVYAYKNDIFVQNPTNVTGKLSIYNTTGLLVGLFEIGANQNQTLQMNLPSGIYLAKTILGNEKVIVPLVIR